MVRSNIRFLLALQLAFCIGLHMANAGSDVDRDAAGGDRVGADGPVRTIAGPFGAMSVCQSWAQEHPAPPIPSIRYATAAFDSVRGVAVLFGGYEAGALFGDTWEWNRTSWVPKTVSGSKPSARTEHATAFDSLRGVTVLFGGDIPILPDGDGDTWEWNGSTWTQRTGPAPRWRFDAAMAYDSARGVMVLYGGIASSGPPLSDTWEWDGIHWTQKIVQGPGARCFHAMAYDSNRGVTVLFGGSAFSDGHLPTNETWEWDGAAWTDRTEAAPPGRNRPGIVFDTSRNTTVLFGGVGNQSGTIIFHDTWEWNGETWSLRNVNAPPGRYINAMWFDTVIHAPAIFGGTTANGESNDTWTLNPDSTIQSQPTPTSTCPSGTAHFAITSDGNFPTTFQWQWRRMGQPTWLNIVAGNNTDGTAMFQSVGGLSSQASVIGYHEAGVGGSGSVKAEFHCILINDCGTLTSNAATLSICSSDFTCDGQVDDADFVVFAIAYDILVCSDPAMPINCPADLNGDQSVDDTDFVGFVNAYNTLLCP